MGLAFTLLALVATQTSQSPSYFKQMVPVLTGQNAYEEYYQAQELLSKKNLSIYYTWTPKLYDQLVENKRTTAEYLKGLPKDQAALEADNLKLTSEELARERIIYDLRGSDYIKVYKLVHDNIQDVHAIVRRGNEKPYYGFRDKVSLSSLFPDLAGYKAIAKATLADSYYLFAIGRSGEATDVLLDTMTFGSRIGEGLLIDRLVSIAISAIVNSGFEANLDHLSETDCKKIERYVSHYLSQPTAYSKVMYTEWQSSRKAFDQIQSASEIHEMGRLFGGDVDAQAEPSSIDSEVTAKWGMPEFNRFRDSFQRAIDRYYGSLVSGYQGTEETWQDVKGVVPTVVPNSTDKSPEALGEQMVLIMIPAFSNAVTAELKARAQVRLLGLHARILQYKWHNRNLPKQLRDAVPANLIHDPMSGEEFVYELHDGTYKLFSRGNKLTGEIALKYKRDPNRKTEEDPGSPIP